MSILNDVNVLCDASFERLSCEFFEEWDEFPQLSNFRELLLEVLPDGVRLHVGGLFWPKQDLFFNHSVKLSRTRVEAPELRALHVPVEHSFMLWIDLEQIFSAVEVYSIVVGQAEVSIDWVSGSGMNVMNSSLWHRVEDFEQVTTLHHFFVLEEIMDGPVQLAVVGNFFSDNFESAISLSLGVGEGGLEPITEMLFGFCLNEGSFLFSQ